MSSSSSTWCACLFAAVCAASSNVALADVCAGEAGQNWLPERSWPAACQRDVPTDGFVVLEGPRADVRNYREKGQLRVQIKRMLAGAAVETFDGEVVEVGPSKAFFRSKVPLVSGTDYVVSAQRLSGDGTPLGAPFTSAFTTGNSPLPALAFAGVPIVQLEAFDKEIERCEAADACEARRCTPTGETVPTHYLRIAVPEITGGLEKLPYRVSAAVRSEQDQATVLANAEANDVTANTRSYMLLELPPRDREGRGCVTITATDAAGHEARAETVCLTLPILEAPAPEPAQANVLRLSTPAPEAESTSAAGCAIGRSDARGAGLMWLPLALTFARRRSRKRSA